MKILIRVDRNKNTGLGHFTRCMALADQARSMGHTVGFVGDADPRFNCYWYLQALDTKAFNNAVRDFKPDWTVVDLPVEAPVKPKTGKLCVIDGLGYQNGQEPHLSVSQGFLGQYCAPEYLILRRQSLERYKGIPGGDQWLVYGGASDEPGLLPTFNRVMADSPANLLVTDLMRDTHLSLPSRHTVVQGQGDAGLGWLATAGKALVHLGVMVWELAYYGVPTWIISRSERHLETALEFERRGYALAWPEVGLPGDNELREWLGRPNEPGGKPFDLNGAERIVRLMEAG